MKILLTILCILLAYSGYSSAEMDNEPGDVGREQVIPQQPVEAVVHHDETGKNIVIIDGWRNFGIFGSLDSCHKELIKHRKQMDNKEHIVTCLLTGRIEDNSIIVECMTNSIDILTFCCDNNGFLLGKGFGTSE